MELSEITQILKEKKLFLSSNAKEDQISFESITKDSRKVNFSSIFFATSIDSIDGHKYISDAIKNGAKLILL